MSSESYQAITALGSCTLGLSVIAVALRFYSRKLQRVPLLADDWIMVPGLVRSQRRRFVGPLQYFLTMDLTSVGFIAVLRWHGGGGVLR